jgi:hypothetical protein
LVKDTVYNDIVDLVTIKEACRFSMVNHAIKTRLKGSCSMTHLDCCSGPRVGREHGFDVLANPRVLSQYQILPNSPTRFYYNVSNNVVSTTNWDSSVGAGNSALSNVFGSSSILQKRNAGAKGIFYMR